MAVASLVYDDPALSAFELDFVEGGECLRLALGQVWNRRFESVDPVREFRWAKGGQGFAGSYFSATVGDHVGYESWLERDRLILLDREPAVVGIASQPFWLRWHDGQRQRRHAPDYFVRLADGRGRVVDVRADDRIDRTDAEAFAATERACRAVGWEFVRVGEPEPVLMENVRWLSRYRRRRCADPEIAARLLDVFAVGTPLRAGAARAGDPLVVLPVLFHLLWQGDLAADLESAPLSSTTSVGAGRRAR
ncbi:TnsA-like heteromeric transposase endonuclease subunit [Kitasatospora sp. NPDC028055]|uniref:TnsA-like heteromeric transposase endonuclease subunit n=1 Tax=Kitasatospora sp. NPDC028055 TaxID=3155653 RepID=UPI0033F85DA1